MDREKYLQAFLADTKTLLGIIATSLDKLRSGTGQSDDVFEVRRSFHSLKSSAAMMKYMDISAVALEMETLVAQHTDQGNGLPADVIDQLTQAQATLTERVASLEQADASATAT